MKGDAVKYFTRTALKLEFQLIIKLGIIHGVQERF